MRKKCKLFLLLLFLFRPTFILYFRARVWSMARSGAGTSTSPRRLKSSSRQKKQIFYQEHSILSDDDLRTGFYLEIYFLYELESHHFENSYFQRAFETGKLFYRLSCARADSAPHGQRMCTGWTHTKCRFIAVLCQIKRITYFYCMS